MLGISEALAFICGTLIGMLGGMVPGLHSNTLITILIGVSLAFSLPPDTLPIFIISIFAAHIVAAFVPAIFFGIPDDSTTLSIVPGQRMVLEGHGLRALRMSLISCAIAVLLATVIFFASLDFYVQAYLVIKGYIQYVLLFVSMILLAKSKRPHFAILIFLLSGLLGFASLQIKLPDQFLPLFAGMFTIAAMIYYKKGNATPQKEDEPLDFGFLRYVAMGVVLGMCADLLPGIGSASQIAAFSSIFVPTGADGFLALTSSLGASQAIFSFSTVTAIDKSRVGGTALLAETIDIASNLPLILTIFIAATAIAIGIVYLFRNKLIKLASFDFKKVNIILGLYLVAITFVLDGFLGLAIMTVAVAVGLLALKLEVERTNLMGAVIVPTLMLLFRIFV